MTKIDHNPSPSREWLSRMADLEDKAKSISAGGIAADLGFLSPMREEAPRVLGRVIELARRRNGWSLEKLSEVANVDLGEVWALEHEQGQYAIRTIFFLDCERSGPSPVRTNGTSGPDGTETERKAAQSCPPLCSSF